MEREQLLRFTEVRGGDHVLQSDDLIRLLEAGPGAVKRVLGLMQFNGQGLKDLALLMQAVCSGRKDLKEILREAFCAEAARAELEVAENAAQAEREDPGGVQRSRRAEWRRLKQERKQELERLCFGSGQCSSLSAYIVPLPPARVSRTGINFALTRSHIEAINELTDSLGRNFGSYVDSLVAT